MYLRHGIGPYAPRGDERAARRVVVPYGRLRRAAAIALGSGAQRSVCGADGRNGLKLRQRSPQKCLSKPDNPSVSLRLTAPFAQGSLGDEGCGLPRRFAPRNDSPDPSSFRGGPTGRRGNPSFLRWTGVRTAVPRAWPPPTKFRTEIWGVGQVVGPYGKRTIKNKENRREPDRFADTSRRRTHHVEETSV